MIRRLAVTGALVLGALGSAGCGDDFAPYNRLTSFRVLAIASDPPAPGPDETATLSALLFTVTDEPVLTYKWSWCPLPGPANEGYRCLMTHAELTDLATAAGGGAPISIPDFDLLNNETATFINTVPVALLQQLCARDSDPTVPTLCNGGFPVQIMLEVTTATDSIIAVRELRLRSDLTEPNLNPKLEGIVAVLGGLEEPITDDPDPTVTIPRDPETVIRVGLLPEVAEPYNGRNDDRVVVGMRERLTLSWFVETGNVKDDKTAFIENAMGVVEPFEDARENRWHPERVKKYPGDIARIVVVIKDNRGGFGWVRGRVRLEASP